MAKEKKPVYGDLKKGDRAMVYRNRAGSEPYEIEILAIGPRWIKTTGDQSFDRTTGRSTFEAQIHTVKTLDEQRRLRAAVDRIREDLDWTRIARLPLAKLEAIVRILDES